VRAYIKLIVVMCIVLLYYMPAKGETLADKRLHQLEKITVTAQKKEEDPQNIPMGIDVVSDIMAEDSMMQNTSELTRFSPNVFMKDSPFENVVVIRGISSFSSSLNAPAAYYVNGVGYALHYMHDNELFDVERIEILKGPQGTLYGRNSESGVINIITKQPDNQFRAKLLGEYGNYNSYRGNATLSGPVIENKLYFGVAAQYKYSDGYIDNLFNGDDKTAKLSHFNGRATLRWTPSDPWDISLIADVVHADDKVGFFRYAKGPNTTASCQTRHDEVDEDMTETGNTQALNINYQSDSFKVTSVTGATYRSYSKFNDSDLWDNPANRMTNDYTYKDRQYSQEIRINSLNQGSLQWLVGLFGSYEETELDHENWNLSRNVLNSHHIANIETQGYAAFGQATYTVKQRLHFTLGLRLDSQKLEGKYRNRANNISAQKDLDFTELLPKASISYDLTADDMIYATVAKGYLTGGFNWCMNPTQDTFHFDPEYSWNYEVGLKSNWLNNKLMANLAVFYITIDDKQVTVVEPDTRLNTITNAAEAYSYGVEIQLRAKPATGLDVFASFGYNQSKFEDFISTAWDSSYKNVVSEDLGGNSLPYAPVYTYNAGAQYRVANGFMGRVDVFGTGKFYGDAANTCEQEAYQLVNARLGYEGKNWEAYLWSKNLFDQEYLTWFQPSGSSLYAMDGPPRTFGITLSYRF